MLVPLRPDERWSLDFVSDQLIDGGFGILTVVDDCTRKCLRVRAETAHEFRAMRLTRIMTAAA